MEHSLSKGHLSILSSHVVVVLKLPSHYNVTCRWGHLTRSRCPYLGRALMNGRLAVHIWMHACSCESLHPLISSFLILIFPRGHHIDVVHEV